MKKIHRNFIVLILVGIFTSCNSSVIVRDVTGIRLESLNSEATKDTILIIDSRSNAEYKTGHIPHAINIPRKEMKNRTKEFIDWAEKPIYIYDNTNDKSFEAAKILVKNNCKIVFNAEGIEQHIYNLITYNDIRGVEFERIAKDDDVVIVDCRMEGEYTNGHIENSISVPITVFEENLNKIPPDKKILVYCNTGTSSARVSTLLTDLGYTKVYNSIDGVREYKFKLVR